MSRRKIYKYVFSFLLFCPTMVIGQEKSVFDGLRVSYDIGTLPALYVFPDQARYELQTDFQFKSNYYGVGEFGLFNLNRNQDTSYRYSQTGSFFRAGVEYNALQSDQDNILTLGGRIGSSFFKHQAKDIFIFSADSIWNNVFIDQFEEQSHSAFWLELTISLKVEIIKNIYMGWTVRGRAMLFGPKTEHLQPYYIPGFGRGDRNTALGFNYYICYKIPLNF